MQSITPEAGAEAATWEQQIASLLEELSLTQGDLLKLLVEKRQLIVDQDTAALGALRATEEHLVHRLTACCQRRQALLDEAKVNGLPGTTLQSLSKSLAPEEQGRLKPAMLAARRRARLLQHHSLANWVLVQRSLLHLSQMIEIFATGGRMQPTYGRDDPSSRGGALVDQAV